MNYNQFENLSCYEEFDMQCTLASISKIDALKEIGHEIDNYYFFVSNDGIFNWFDLKGNHIKDPGILRLLKAEYISTSLTTCIIPNSIKYICNYAFHNCRNLKEITIPNNVTHIGDYVFSHCDSLTSISIPNSVISTGNGAFWCCKSLTSITISKRIAIIRDDTFSHCTSLKEVIFKGKTLKRVKLMLSYPFGIRDESIIKGEK